MSSEFLTTGQAAEAAGLTPAAFRRAASRAREQGIELRAPEHEWPDKRTPMWSAEAVTEWLATRPGRGTRTDLTTKEQAK